MSLFRFYNTMYTLFATSIILIYIPQESGENELAYLYKLVEMAIEILEIMDESVVAMQAAKMIRGALARARSIVRGDATPMEFDKTAPWNNCAGLFDFIDGDFTFDMPFPPGDPPAMYAPIN